MTGTLAHRTSTQSLRRALVTATAVFFLAGIAGCHGGGAGGGGSAGTAGPPSTAGSEGMNNPHPDAGKTVAIISPAKTSEFHQQLPMGAGEEAKRLGWRDILDQAPQREDDYQGQVSLAEDVIQRHPDAISVCGINPDALNSIIEKANTAKIPVFVHNQITPVKAGDVVSYIGYDERAGGKLCGEEAAELLKQKNGAFKGTVAILDGEPGTHTDDRAGGFREALRPYKDITVLNEKNGKWDRAEGASITRDWLQQYPTLDLIFGCSDAMVQGAAEAAKQAAHPLLTIGIDGNKSSLQDIADGGKLTATLSVQPRKMGAKIIDTMKDYFDGKNPPKVVLTEMAIVTKSNVDKFIQK